MQYMTTAEIREKYLSYFEDKGCQRWPSSSLIPDDPSLLLTSAGMVQFKQYFLQQKHIDPKYIGTTTVQKCVRTNDIDIIGTTGRHLSFFEMLGNFSFGEYFKQEMCTWAYDFSVNVLGLPPEKLYFTVFEDDDETIEIWKSLGVPESHISKLGEDDNFWRAGPTGPCGPCSELYFDQGPEHGCGSPDCAPGCDCDRFLEYWNCVFTQYDGQEDGTLKPLPKKNIDTGMGLERMAAIMQGVSSNYETDVLRSLVGVGERIAGIEYGADAGSDLSLRIIADHSRAVSFMISDGILPSNEGRGYVLRRLLRRAVMKMHLLGVDRPFLNEYVDEIVRLMGDVYPEIVENRELIARVILSEEERFGATLRQGKAYLEEALAALETKTLSGRSAFTLHDTYGFPIEVTEEICSERGIAVDAEEFAACMEEQRTRAREANRDDAEAAWSIDGTMGKILEQIGETEFTGYTQDETDACVRALLLDGAPVDALEAGQTGTLIADKSPFYAEKGGQIGDTGRIVADGFVAEVTDTQAPEKGLIAHTVTVVSGRVECGQAVHLAIDVKRRECIRRNHTATHILHWALRQVLGDHAKQAGSLVTDARLRFDFTHFEAVTADQLALIERLANEKVMEAHAVNTYETTLVKAREAGVTALFGEKYGEFVRVVDVDPFSQELCGGTHVRNTAEIGFIKITSESSVGANLRRIEAVTSYGAYEYINELQAELGRIAELLKVRPAEAAKRVEGTIKSFKEAQAALKRSKQSASDDKVTEALETVATSKAGYPVAFRYAGEADAGTLRNMWDVLRARMGACCAVVLAGNNDGTPILLAAGTDEAVAAGFNAGAIIKAIAPCVKGGGGGKPTMAQAGGKDVSGIEAALEAARAELL